jgi:hypothetical protein
MVQGLIIVLKQKIKLKHNLPKDNVKKNYKLASNDTFIYFPFNPNFGCVLWDKIDIQPPYLDLNLLINEKYIGG